jgi:hypothetical protein
MKIKVYFPNESIINIYIYIYVLYILRHIDNQIL